MQNLGKTDFFCIPIDLLLSVRRGAATMVVTRGDPTNPERVDVRLCTAGVVTSSCKAKLYAVHEALL